MAILEESSALELQQLLELFPIANIRQAWPKIDGGKEEACKDIAAKKDFPAISEFVCANVGCCKQHVYLFNAGRSAKLPEELPVSSLLGSASGAQAIFIAKKQYDVILTENMSRKSIVFLWPLKLQLLLGSVAVQFVMLEKNLRSHLADGYVVENRGLEESDILKPIKDIGALPVNVHKGIKDLWEDGFMDCPRLKYVDPESTTETIMRDARGIKEFNPTLYKKVKSLELISAVFALKKDGQAKSVHGFSVEPTDGYLAMHRYSERKGDAEIVISEILTRNQ